MKVKFLQDLHIRESIDKKVMFQWTLSVPPLAPPPGLRTLRGVFFFKIAYQRLATIGEKSA